ncbi:MAG: tRNA (guanosine(37)-N1)-methyltransferase TrmD [Gammaproteobacteria bacterium]|jgi:tRNA (guanine37-N1)-methyltransferase
MQIGVISLFPQMFDVLSEYGVTARAVRRGLVRLQRWNPRDFAVDRHRLVDDRPFGGGPGMVMAVEPLRSAIRAARASMGTGTVVVYLTPQGRTLDHERVTRLVSYGRLLLVCARYEGVDERLVLTEIDEECSIGDYVLTGGELPAMVVIDAVTRQLPGVLGHQGSALEDSFAKGLLNHPQYTRPVEIDGLRVPSVLLSGNHAAIRRWRLKQALGRTWLRRPDLLHLVDLTNEQQALLAEFVREHRQLTGAGYAGTD